jgi:capsular exopolysaccharide synthesis family protein
VFGLIGGLGVALTRDLLDNRVYKPEQIRALGYRDIGMIPNLTPLINNQLGGQPTVEKNGRQLESTLVGAIQPNSAAAEAYRKLRTNVWYNGRDEEVSTVVVTSPGSKDGKSVTSANLAVVTARAGHSTLLIDADLRRPRLHEVFDASQAPGLAEALQDDLREHVMEKASVENLCVLPAGGRLENPSKTLGSQEFGKFLSRAQQHFDYVILDSPPVLATADSAILAAQCDETLCVVRAGRTTESELQDAMEMLDGVKANIAGIVFNGFDLSMAYGYKYRYRNYTEYGPYDQYQALPEKAGDQ